MAEKEGQLIFYTTMDFKTANTLRGDFEKQTTMKVEVFRSGIGKVLAQIEAEFAA